MASPTCCRRTATESRKPNNSQASIAKTVRHGGLRFHQFLAIRLERSLSAGLVELHEAAITDPVGS